MSFYNMSASVIVFTTRPRLVLAKLDENSCVTEPSPEVIKLFGSDAKVVPLQDVWPDFYVEQAQSILGLGDDENWVIVSLILHMDDGDILDAVPNKLMDEFEELVRRIPSPEPGLIDYLWTAGQGSPRDFVESDMKMDFIRVAEGLRCFKEKLEAL